MKKVGDTHARGGVTHRSPGAHREQQRVLLAAKLLVHVLLHLLDGGAHPVDEAGGQLLACKGGGGVRGGGEGGGP